MSSVFDYRQNDSLSKVDRNTKKNEHFNISVSVHQQTEMNLATFGFSLRLVKE